MDNHDLSRIASAEDLLSVHEAIPELRGNVLLGLKLYPTNTTNKACTDFLVGSKESFTFLHQVWRRLQMRNLHCHGSDVVTSLPCTFACMSSHVIVCILHNVFLLFSQCMQDAPLQCRSAILCLHGRKMIALLPDVKGKVLQELHGKRPTAASLESMVKQHKGQLVTLSPGDGLIILPGVWHAAVNLEFCISVNTSVCYTDEVLPVVEASLALVVERCEQQRFGAGFLHLISGYVRTALSDARALHGRLRESEHCPESTSDVMACAKGLQCILLRWSAVLLLLQAHADVVRPKCTRAWLREHEGLITAAHVYLTAVAM